MDLSHAVAQCRIFVDTCSIMHQKSQDFFSKLAPILMAQQKQIIIPHKVVSEINRLQSAPAGYTKNAAKAGAVILKRYLDHGLLDIRGERNDPFADNVFVYVFSKFRTQYDLALITQDRSLAMHILFLKDSKTIHSSKKLLVLKIGYSGDAEIWRREIEYNQNNKKEASSPLSPFQLFNKPRSQADKPIVARKIPDVGDYIEAENFGKVRLHRIIGEGGEGKIFLTDTGHACKVYFEERLTENRLQKLLLMSTKKVHIPGVCWPLAIAKNQFGEFVGYIMPLADGKPMQKCMFVKPLLEKYFSHWTRMNLVVLAISWLEKVIALHRHRILIGDVNPLNFLIKSDREIYFVDTDSYQVEDFPCPVGMANFTAPEIQKRDFTSFLRTPEQEYFAIATLLFMILLPGKPPYSHQGGGDPRTNIQKGQFSYPLGKISDKKTPDGPWRYIWSHMPYKMKEAFYNCFVDQKRISPEKWLDLLNNYRTALEKNHLDPEGESQKLFPTRFKKVSDYAKKTYGCRDEEWEQFNCYNCGKTFHLKSGKGPKEICRNCFQIQKSIEHKTGTTIYCSDCGSAFLFSMGEQKFYDSKCLEPPKRCLQCRENRKHSKSFGKSSQNRKNTEADNGSIWGIFGDILKDIFG